MSAKNQNHDTQDQQSLSHPSVYHPVAGGSHQIFSSSHDSRFVIPELNSPLIKRDKSVVLLGRGGCSKLSGISTPASLKILTDFLIDKENNNKWLNLVKKELRVRKNHTFSQLKEPEDYISEAKLDILETAEIINPGTTDPWFCLMKEGREYSGNLDALNLYVCALIKWDISHTFYYEKKLIPLPQKDDDDEPLGEGEMLWDEETLNESFILQFNDPFEDNKDLIAMELIEKCYTLLEEKNPAYTKIFDERLKGNPNRVIAQVLNLDISIVEGIWKKIMRLLRKKIPRRPLEQLFTNNIGN